MRSLLIALVFLPLSLSAKAEALPAFVLDKEYQACMAGDNKGLEKQKQIYCLCIRDKLAQMDGDTFVRLAQEAKSAGINNPPAFLQDMAQECIATSLR